MSIFNKILNEKYSSISGLTDELKAIYINNQHKNNSIIVVTNTIYEANILVQRLRSYTEDVLFFPMDDFLTSESIAISPEFKTTRLETIYSLINNPNKIVVTNLMGYLRYLPKMKLYKSKILDLEINKDYDMNELIHKLYILGYTKETLTSVTGTYSTRGYVIDVFPIKEEHPIRLEFFGDTLDEIKYYDENTQMTISKIDKISILPDTEFITNEDVDLQKQNELPNYTEVVNINEYLDNPLIIYHNYSELEKNYELLQEEIEDYNRTNNFDLSKKYMNNLEDIKEINNCYLLNFDNSVKDTQNYKSYNIEDFPTKKEDIEKLLNSYIKSKKTVIICVSDQYKINKILDYLELDFILTNESEIFENKINIIEKNILNGFIFENYVFISETEIFHKKNIVTKYHSNFKYGVKIRDINKLNIGDYIVHNLYGIGRYVGLKTLVKNGFKKDYLTVEYQDSDKLYIPVEKIELISKFSSNEGVQPKINKLGSSEWEKTKLKVRKKIEDIAGDLIKLYAIRESSVGFAMEKDDENQVLFESEFPFNETNDQLKATEEIKKDMESIKPMDRLLCGDVGFGKTEVAFRAIFKAILSGKQVAYLCPTTILSNQQYNNAIERFKTFPVRIEILNRFVTAKKTKEILEDLKEGKIDLLIGTHRLLSKDVVFKNLGLLVIDEEQRFGVKHKEQIKQIRNNIDVLTLSATPIPRTLQMSMMGIRNLSLIETPPTNRYPVQTYVLEENDSIIKSAIYKELARNGQVFILYNYVSDIENKKNELQKLLPDVKIKFAHGRMIKKELEDVMISFINKEFDVLLCTTIIETGIDIPSANTLIIIDADHFGLSQLYQIRGRVGRSNKIAYCYLMYNKGKSLSDVATKRLNVIKEFTELGSGFSIAMRDLSIRGAGDILGSEQAGFIDTIGIDLYLQMLDEEIKKIKGLPIKEISKQDERPLLDIETTIDDNYVDDTDLKIEIHKKINEIDSYDKLLKIKTEIEDRFGKISDNLLIYMHEEWFEKLAKKLNINQIRQTPNFIEVTLPKEITDNLNGELFFKEVSSLSRMFRFSKKHDNIIVTLDIIKLDKHFIYYLIDLLKTLDKTIKR